jgi:3-deoxy-manno-octulosonate cytidylyltransferase (CMP-KDO synthetase)
MKNIILIPSRYDSSRLVKKSLVKIISHNKTQSLIEHVFKRCQKSKLYNDIYILTDHQDIVDEVHTFSKNVLMTDNNLASGTDRVYQGATLLEANDDDFIINIQGDCALIDPSLIDDLIKEYQLQKDNADIFTFVSKITNKEDLLNNGEVKVVLDNNKKAIYFSRSPIPYLREKEDESITIYYKHLGIYGYSYKFLKTFVNLKVGNLEQIERLEQLRAIENGYSIQTILTDKTTFDINYQQDVDNLNKILAKR